MCTERDCLHGLDLHDYFVLHHQVSVKAERRPRYRKRKGKSTEWEVAVEKPTYDLTIFKLHCGKLTLKIYTKGERVLRLPSRGDPMYFRLSLAVSAVSSFVPV